MSSEEKELIDKAQMGSRKAFDLLIIKYQNKLFKHISYYLRDPHEALDVLQETFIKAYRALPAFRKESKFYTWLYRIAMNTAKNHLAQLGRQPINPDVDFEASLEEQGSKEYEGPESHLISAETKQAIIDTIENLPPELKKAITLRELGGLSYTEIAAIMECPIGTVRSRIFRAREMIDANLKKLMNQE